MEKVGNDRQEVLNYYLFPSEEDGGRELNLSLSLSVPTPV